MTIQLTSSPFELRMVAQKRQSEYKSHNKIQTKSHQQSNQTLTNQRRGRVDKINQN